MPDCNTKVPLRSNAMARPKRPIVVVTRKLPDSIEIRMRELFDTRLNADDKPMSQAELAEAGQDGATCWCRRSPTASMTPCSARPATSSS